MKVSIVIPTYQKLEQCLKPCLKSVLEHLSTKHDYEIVIVANGCTDGTQQFISEQANERIKLLDYPEALGATKALNRGIENSTGDIVVLLNNDITIHGNVDEWLDILLEPFSDDKAGVVGAEKRWHEMGGGDVIPFFCAAIRKSILDELRNLDEIFSPGTCEDVDFCRKTEKAGYKLIQKNIPVKHSWQSTMSTIKGISDICKRNDKIVFERHNTINKAKVSIVISTYNHLEDCLKPCCESIKKYCNLENKEVIVVANGCTDGTREYVESLGFPFKLLWFDEALGATRAYNEGIKASKNEYILLLNNDVALLDQSTDLLIKMHIEKFAISPNVGIVGPIKSFNKFLNREFIIFFCAMIKKEVFDKIGYLDEVFGEGSSEDIDFCIRAQDAGYELAVAGEMTGHSPSEGRVIGSVPIYHKGEVTVNDKSLVTDWDKTFKSNIEILLKKYQKRVSIIIGTLNHLDDLLKPCCESIIKYCNLDDKEIIIVANGCTDGTREYVESLGKPFKLLWFDEPLGFPKAYNKGISIATGEYILLLNNDTVLLEQEKDALINMHLEQFEKSAKVGIVGPLKNLSPCVNREFIVFFCAMIKRELFEKIGLLDEDFLEGQGEDTYFCIRAEEEGYEIAVVGQFGRVPDGGTNSGSVPIYHKGEGTLHDDPEHSAKVERNTKILVDKYTKRIVKVLCVIPTKGRYFTTLPLAIQSVILQTVKPDRLVIYDDGEHKDLRGVPTYAYLFKSLDDVGIKWEVAFGNGSGQHFGHQKVNTSDFKYVWRLDDDTVAKPDVLEKLLSHMAEGVGAVAGSVITPGGEARSNEYGIKLLDVNRLPNIQWAKGEGVVEVEHLYSSFLYRTNIVDYCLELSKVAHREETIFSHRLFQAGYKLLVDRSAVTYHYRNPEGGIRAEKDVSLWEHDEQIFRKELEKWGYKMIALSHGLGDHLMFANIVPELLKRCKTLVLFCVYAEVFMDFPNVVCRPLGDAASFGIKETGVYEWMTKYSWRKSMLKAYEQLYLG